MKYKSVNEITLEDGTIVKVGSVMPLFKICDGSYNFMSDAINQEEHWNDIPVEDENKIECHIQIAAQDGDADLKVMDDVLIEYIVMAEV